MTSKKSNDNTSSQQRLAKLAAVFLCIGVAVFGAAILSGSQGTIMSLCPVGLFCVLAGLLAAIPARRTLLAKVVIVPASIGLAVGVLLFAFILVLAAGFSQMR